MSTVSSFLTSSQMQNETNQTGVEADEQIKVEILNRNGEIRVRPLGSNGRASGDYTLVAAEQVSQPDPEKNVGWVSAATFNTKP